MKDNINEIFNKIFDINGNVGHPECFRAPLLFEICINIFMHKVFNLQGYQYEYYIIFFKFLISELFRRCKKIWYRN